MATLQPILRFAAASFICAGLAAPAQAQDKPDNWLTRLFQPPATAAVPAPAGGTHEWSGQSGASGHPLMTAEAIRAAAADFGNCIAALWPLAERRGVSRANFERYTAGLTPDLSIMDLLDAQPEFNKSTWDYLDALVSDERIARGRELLAQYAPMFAAVERAYGVDRHIVAAIWGVESNYGTMGGERSGAPLDGDARLRRPPPRVFPRGVSVGAGHPAARRRRARPPDRLLGRRLRPDAIHADHVQALRGRFRRRRPARRGRLGRRCHRLDRQQSENRRLGRAASAGATKWCCRRNSITSSPTPRGR